MKINKLISLCLYLCLGCIGAKGQVMYDTYFIHRTLRMDFSLIGNNKEQKAAVERFRQEPVWAGPTTALIDPFHYGDYFVNVYDAATKLLIYSRGFNTLFGEWLLTDEAKNETQSWGNSVVVPFPKAKIEIEITARYREDMQFHRLMRMALDPTDIEIDRGSLKHNPIINIKYSGNPAHKVDLVFVGDGYTKAEQTKFEQDAKRFANALFNCPPFDKVKKDFNVWGVQVVSEESGVDFSGEGVYKNTALNAGFYTFGIDRYLTTRDIQAVRDAVWETPTDAVFILVNTDRYGGGGFYNFYALGSADNAKTASVFVHEFGHSFAGLGDEYYYASAGQDEFYNLQYEPWEPNITSLKQFDKKWKDLLPEETPIPTPIGEEGEADKLGVYEGAGYMRKGLYRPYKHCMMKDLKAFCPVCQRAILRMVDYYTGREVTTKEE